MLRYFFTYDPDRFWAQFDLIVCSEAIEHLRDREQARKNMTGRVYDTERHFGHVSHPTVDELVSLGSANGLSVVRS